ncbi:Uma2 family endonuclease [Sphaerimonospora thailandensis]|uniref:Putative restriction endonuclease domain-containing protein n=1 Tax=Sphaerimonospora thailandensis TaxID=795644 RepID=A0A8J3R7R6_9ACTN|nr:Uma2 family endonuclease [Sphaerimonospora thailandensis]GIH70657.1 hypothetical protein Mth01_29100 [Sphaerimonospora thailandensis]
MAKVLDPPATTPEETARADLQSLYRKICFSSAEQKVEILRGRVVIREVPTLDHNNVVFRLLLQLMSFVDSKKWVICNDIKIFLGAQLDRYRPDATVVPRSPRMWDPENVYGNQTLLVVEVVSPSSQDDDHVMKPKNCAIAGVPLYLVIDTFQNVARLMAEPSENGYQHQVEVTLGKPLPLPEPWDLTIDTGKLIEA